MNNTITLRKSLHALWTDFYGWKKGEYAWLIVASTAILGISFILGSTTVEVISALTGIIGAILVARAKLSSYVWGIIATATYGWIAFEYRLFGEAILYAFLFLPMHFIGYFVWLRAARVSAGEKIEVVRRLLRPRQRVLLALATIALIAGYTALLRLMNGAAPGLDSATAILSVLATGLMMMRYGEQWLVWIMVNCVAIILWIMMVVEHQTQGWAVLAMWVLYLLNAIYGWWKWRRAEG